jgi:hypothetical protein
VRFCRALATALAKENYLFERPITVKAGMAPGLPLATAQSAYAGTIMKGRIFQAFGNWVGTDMTIDFMCMAGPDASKKTTAFSNPTPPKNIVLNWKKGKQLKEPLKKALETAFPNLKVVIDISDKLIAPQDQVGFYANLDQFGDYLRRITQSVVGGKGYTGVGF